MSTDGAGDQRLDVARCGVYRAAAGPRRAPAPAGGLDLVSISLAGVASKDALLERFAAALAFPDWFGGNWDALEDCLGDLSWRADGPRVLVIDGFEALQAAARDDFRVLLDLLADVADHWSAQGCVFCVIFVDPGRRLGLRTWGDASA